MELHLIIAVFTAGVLSGMGIQVLIEMRFARKNKCVLPVVGTRTFTKKDLLKAWLHGDIRVPMEMQHLNNFDEYYKHTYKK